MNPRGGKREGSGRPTRGDRPTVTKSFSLTPKCVELLERRKPADVSMSAFVEAVLTDALGKRWSIDVSTGTATRVERND